MAAAVVDASVLVDLLLTRSPVARSALAGTDPFAPELIDAEAMSAIARAVRSGVRLRGARPPRRSPARQGQHRACSPRPAPARRLGASPQPEHA